MMAHKIRELEVHMRELIVFFFLLEIYTNIKHRPLKKKKDKQESKTAQINNNSDKFIYPVNNTTCIISWTMCFTMKPPIKEIPFLTMLPINKVRHNRLNT